MRASDTRMIFPSKMQLDTQLYSDKFLPIKILVFKLMYQVTLWKLRARYGKRKIRVGFLVSEIAKWKGQTLYDYLATSADFDPIIYVFPSHRELMEELPSLNSILTSKTDYFKNSGMAVENIWDSEVSQQVLARQIDSDIVFYQQTWDIPPAPYLKAIAPKALTFYFPYYLVNNSIPQLEIGMYLHHYVYRYILLNEEQVNLYKPLVSSFHYAGKMIGLGHPCIDVFYLNRGYKATKNYVIYAPHFSFKGNRRQDNELFYYSSTFLEQGRLILDYAKRHPEINWVFKPHPRLKMELFDQNVWQKEEIDEYYREWERIGIACYDSHYADLFLESKAMITDCSSFLTEYSCTGKPIIRLIPDEGRTLPPPNPILVQLYDSYYKVYNNTELLNVLDVVVIQEKDPRKEERLKCIREVHLADHYAAKSITEYLRLLLKR